MFRFGVDYYPEHWPKERWALDAKLMKEAGFNVVRLGEFAWSKMEPREGEFRFDWLEEAIDILAAEGIQAVLGTPTASIPPWLEEKYPDVLRVEENKTGITYGNRQNTCVNHPRFRALGDRVTEEMAKRFGKHEAVLGWQIDNEFWLRCYCERCRLLFHEWLQAKYADLEAVNRAWGTEFWSQEYTKWSQIPLPLSTCIAPNPGLALDYKRFMADSYTTFSNNQIKILREYSPDKLITHNFMGIWPENLDYAEIAKEMDFASWDNYPGHTTWPIDAGSRVAGHAITRCYKPGKNFWVMEQQSGPTGWGDLHQTPKPGQIRLWTYQSIAHGADGIVYFRWRPCRSGTEQYWHGVLDHDGSTNRRYAEIKGVGAELAKIGEKIVDTHVPAEVAIVNDYTSRWAFQVQRSNHRFEYARQIREYLLAFHALNVPVDIVQPDADFSKYKLVIVPSMFVLVLEAAEKFKAYVKDGGTIVATFRTGVKDESSLIYNEQLPALLRDLFGARVMEYHSPIKDEENFIEAPGIAEGASAIDVWLDLVEPSGAEVIATYSGDYTNGAAAATVNKFGAGKAVYMGTWPDQDFLRSFASWLIGECGLEKGIDTPENVEATVRDGDGYRLMFINNHTGENQKVTVGDGWKGLLGEPSGGEVELGPYGTVIIERAM